MMSSFVKQILICTLSYHALIYYILHVVYDQPNWPHNTCFKSTIIIYMSIEQFQGVDNDVIFTLEYQCT